MIMHETGAPDDSHAAAPETDDQAVTTMVLLVDDQAFVGEAVRRLLADDRRIAFHFCSDPLEAVQIANLVSPTVILLDLVMPNVDGLELLARFRANPATAETPIVVLSTKEDARVKRDAFASGASDYLVKLPDKVELLARVRYHSEACLNLRRRAEIAAALRGSQRTLAERVAELQAALEEIEALQRSKADFYSMVTHDLRNPAGNVLVAAKMLLQGKGGALTPKQEQLVQITATAGDKLLRLITDYLDFAKIDAGYLRLDREQTEVREIVRRAATAAEPQIGVKRQQFTVDLPITPVFGVLDAPKLEQALENLLSNAIKYTPDDGRINLSLSSGNGRARITVRDSGPGIDPTLLPTIFAKYHRLPGDASRSTAGTGLGLLIAKEIVEGHGGCIEVMSSGIAGEGTTFVIDVPLAA
ncbi:MAG: response regulator receiver sensor signal transduction histidine kinase [Gemmatimonadetes bacterium]|jgi:signal transduction histidine kinase|nr:response regulator receiver sensor signal transduction histidine kinase [Gemmatimonadota bacterium]